jgi:nucleoside-diphosphate-sugar epimerase
LRLLLLGGTKFLGRHIVDAATSLGHEVVLFNRGLTNPELYPQLERVTGDRDGELSALEGRSFDGVIDTSGYIPRIVRQSAELLSERCGFYVFISSISVYPDGTPPGFDELSPVQELDDPASENIAIDYGPLKVACERVVQECFPDRSLQVRAGLIVGPHDHTGRFTYWVRRVAAGGEVLAPAPAAAPVQFIDARDVAAWTVSMVEGSRAGVFNVTGPADRLTFGELLAACAGATDSDARFTWVDPAFLLERGVEPWSELPLWLPGAEAEGMLQANIGRATGAGLRFTPLEQTVRDTREWVDGLGEAPGDAGMASQRESDLLAQWRSAS